MRAFRAASGYWGSTREESTGRLDVAADAEGLVAAARARPADHAAHDAARDAALHATLDAAFDARVRSRLGLGERLRARRRA